MRFELTRPFERYHLKVAFSLAPKILKPLPVLRLIVYEIRKQT